MNTSDLIKSVTDDGLTLQFEPPDRLIMDGPSEVADKWRSQLREHKLAIIGELRPIPIDFEERYRAMCARWRFTPEEITEGLNAAIREPRKALACLLADEKRSDEDRAKCLGDPMVYTNALQHKVPTENWTAPDWQEFFHERAAIGEFDGHLSREDSEIQAFQDCVRHWLYLNQVESNPRMCAHCQQRHDFIGPYLTRHSLDKPNYTWLHQECSVPWQQERRRLAIDTLLNMGIEKPAKYLAIFQSDEVAD